MQADLYQDYDVPEELKPFVRRIVYCDCDADIDINLPATPTVYNYFSWIVDGTWEAVGALDSSKVSAGSVSLIGQIYKAKIRVLASGRFRHVAAELTSAGLTALFGEYSKDYQNRVVEIDDDHIAYSDCIALMNNNQWSEKPIEDALQQLISSIAYYSNQSETKNKVPHYILEAVEMAEGALGNLTVDEMSGAQNVEFFSKQFSRYIGIPPKYFAQVIRVNATLLTLVEAEPDQLANIAHERGYFDESHLIKEVRMFFDSSPTQLRESVDAILKAFPIGSQMIGTEN